MKKFTLVLIACIAMAQSAYGATSALVESLLEIEAITTAIGTNPDFENIIPQDEFIIEIERETRVTNILGNIEYEIETHSPRHQHHIKYIATINVAPNPGIGPNIVTVLSIVPKHHH